jgi:ADP-heptose:LPS heptosyltransferase
MPPSHSPAGVDPERAIVVAGAERLGDLLFATAALARLRAARPDLALLVLTAPGAAEAIEGEERFGRAIAPARIPGPLGRLLHVRRAARAIARALASAAIDARGARLVAIRDRASYAPIARRAGIRYAARDLLSTRYCGHQSARSAQALGELTGVPIARSPEAIPPELALGAREAEIANRAIVATGLAGPGMRFVVFHVGSGDARLFGPDRRGRDWPEDRWAALARELAGADPRLRFLLHGRALAERLRARRIAALAGPAAARLPPLHARALAGVMARAALVVATDTGPLHLATAVGAPALGLFGPTDPALTGPVGRLAPTRALRAEADGRCNVSVEDAASAARELLQFAATRD